MDSTWRVLSKLHFGYIYIQVNSAHFFQMSSLWVPSSPLQLDGPAAEMFSALNPEEKKTYYKHSETF